MINNIADFFQSVFGPIVNILGGVLLYFHQSLGVAWWLSIVMLTVIVRSLLFPLTVKQVRSMRGMQDLKPHMDRVRAQFKDNPQRQREEMAKLYQEQGVNPLGGCLPIVVQMPIFIGMFYVIRKFGGIPGRTPPEYESFTHGGILWFQDLAHADPYYILPIISAVTMLASTEITAKNVDPQQRWLMRLLPVGFTVFLLNFPAGLFMYWITSNFMTLVQNYAIYNYGPGRKTSDGAMGSDGSKSKGTANDRKAEKNGNEQAAASSQEDVAKQAAKIAKRKRRKKKK
jgi:YidC/Oxa1 family membrane protein insertase